MGSSRPGGAHGESWLDKVIEEARARGEFDDLAGAGKPLSDLDRPHDELWWVRKKLRDEGVSYLPPALAMRKRKEETLSLVAAAVSESRVRELLSELNDAIRELNRKPAEGPPSALSPVDVEEAVASWRRERGDGVSAAEEPEPTGPASPMPRPRRSAHRPHRPSSTA